MAVQESNLVGKQFRFESKNYPNHFIRHQNWKIFKHEYDPSQLYQLDSSFDVIPGVAGQGISLRSVNYPSYYIRHYKRKGECFIHSSDVKASFKEDASWIPCPGLADPKGVSFESVNFPGQFMRHCNDRVRKDINNNTQLFLDDATWYPRLIKTVDDQVEQASANDGIKESVQQSTSQIDGPHDQQSVPDNDVMDSLKLKEALARERELQQQLEEANHRAEKEKEEAEKRIKAAEEKKVDLPQETEPLRITQHPTDKTKHCKQGTMLAVRAYGGSGTLTYQWLKDGEYFSEDSLPNCIGVNSDTLQFLSLVPEHSGTYMCRVGDERACIIESKPAVLQVISQMKLSDFLCESAERQDRLVIIREGLIQKFHAFLQESGRMCADDLNAIMEDLETHATVNYDDATIDFTTQRVETRLSYLGTPKVFTNTDNEDREEQFTEIVTYTVGSETSKTRVKGWSVSGGLVGGYEGVQAGAGATYESQTIKTQLAVQGVERTENFDKIIVVPRESRVKVAIEKRIETFMCDVSDLVVTFSGKKSTIKCKVGKMEKPKQVKTKTFQLEDVFGSGSDHPHHHLIHGKELTLRLNGKCTWTETSASVQCNDPEPLQIRK